MSLQDQPEPVSRPRGFSSFGEKTLYLTKKTPCLVNQWKKEIPDSGTMSRWIYENADLLQKLLA
jgi:hypothetical protein